MLACACVALPIGIAGGFGTSPQSWVVPWLFALITASIGLPFIALSASAPLLQSWFATTNHPQARNPYVLYAASNLGSFVALLAYPFLAEPLLTLAHQTRLWSAGYAVLIVLIVVAALFAAREQQATASAMASASPRPGIGNAVLWAVLAAIPSGLVIALTAYVTTDIAAAPFFWVLPLALYILTFVAVFRERPWISDGMTVRLVPFAVAPVAISVLGGERVYWFAVVVINLLAFVLVTLVCHGALYRRRPEPALLTKYYLWVSFGGVVGGVFAGLIAPNVFNGTYEYPILLAASLLVLPGALHSWRRFLRDVGPPLFIALTIIVAHLRYDVRLPMATEIMFEAVLVGFVALMLLFRERPARFFGLAVLALVASELCRPGVARIEIARSFFGVHQVVETQTAKGRYRVLFHGTTVHGAQQIRDSNGEPVAGAPAPLAYYYLGGPISEAIEAARSARGQLQQVAVIGLGTGSLACHSKKGELWTFYEIDPVVARIARDPQLFSFMSECGQNPPVIMGDARLTLAASEREYDLIVLDAFSSDSIPVHLLTREALAGYLVHLSRQGVLLFHISNRHLDLLPVIAAGAAKVGLAVIAKRDDRANNSFADYRSNALVAVLARNAADLGELPNRPGWVWASAQGISEWTDDYSNVFGALFRKKLGQ
jgi:NADH:ubiquinone oxidoreductase subunit K